MKRYLTRLLALVLVVTIGLIGCATPTGITGDYRQDTLALVQTLRTAIELPDDSPEKAAVQAEARQRINDFAARYRRDSSLTALRSFTTMRTALNNIAGHYSSYPNRPLPEKLKQRLEQELTQVENALRQGV
ncbi:photosystem II protein Psb27 [Planktothrix sp. FACHB-1355]|uniref:Photosystem II lipoprotein Psb27 n=1 Tax=Aerosakkonema funiforme FACHB-1375 TaxID=2949571 RepID=A0A926VDC6_9CYAN|nr:MULTISPECIES: photosystem II protein Psb27 [Oscillatoriales]MBD2180807.1 photosystem II protein Psb27 [Aerosakkonema funiforme FACHB-1375]MBD3561362.1 photosystem II protein Psb27 [Planktothrix sp. FACHB-1355]